MRKIVLLAAVAAAALSAAAPARAESQTLTFATLDNPADPTFNQLLGINNKGEIAGYFGSGGAGHPNQGYTIAAPYTTFVPANMPASTQTQATGIKAGGTITGFWSSSNTGVDPNFGFIRWNNHGKFRYLAVNDPLVSSTPTVNQVLGINKSEIAVGFYNDANNASHGYAFTVKTGQFRPVTISGAVSLTATGINNSNLVSGFYTDANNVIRAFLKPLAGGTPVRFAVPGASATEFFGVNDRGEAVGSFTLKGATHGLLYNPANGQWQQIDDAKGALGTVLNGLNDKGQIVGFYTDAANNVHGLLIGGAR